MSLKSQKDLWDIVSTIVQIAAILGGGLFALFEYLQAAEASRVKETLAYVDRYQKSPIHEIRMRLESAWVDYEPELEAKLHEDDTQYTKFILKVVNTKHLAPDIYGLITFFESMATCTQSEICDEASAKSFFCSDAKSFFNLHYRFIAHVREQRNDPAVAALLQQFVTTQCRR